MPEKIVVRKYGSKRLSVAIPRSLENEVVPGDPCQAYVSRKHKAIIYLFPDEKEIVNEEEFIEEVLKE